MKFAFRRGDVTMVLPVNPESVSLRYGARTVSFSPLNVGKIEIPRGRNPSEITLNGRLFGPGRNLPLQSEWTTEEVKEELVSWIGEKQIRFIVSEANINMTVFIQNFEPEPDGAHGDYVYSMQLMESRPLSVRTFNESSVESSSTEPEDGGDSSSGTQTYTVKKGDTLWEIAQSQYQDGSKYKDIQNANSDKISDPDAIQPGWELTIP